MNLIKIIFVILVNLFIIKRILYQIEGKEINIKKMLSWEVIKRVFKLVFYLFIINFLPYIINLFFYQGFKNNTIDYNFTALLFLGVFLVALYLFLIMLNFIVINFEKNPVISFEYMREIMNGYKVKLIIMNLAITIITVIFLYIQINSMYSFYMTSKEVKRIESIIRNSCIFFGYFMFLLHLGYYKILKLHKDIRIEDIEIEV